MVATRSKASGHDLRFYCNWDERARSAYQARPATLRQVRPRTSSRFSRWSFSANTCYTSALSIIFIFMSSMYTTLEIGGDVIASYLRNTRHSTMSRVMSRFREPWYTGGSSSFRRRQRQRHAESDSELIWSIYTVLGNYSFALLWVWRTALLSKNGDVVWPLSFYLTGRRPAN